MQYCEDGQSPDKQENNRGGFVAIIGFMVQRDVGNSGYQGHLIVPDI
jgi:hypothetical protein